MKIKYTLLLFVISLCGSFTFGQDKPATPPEELVADEPAWVKPMSAVHARFKGKAGYVAQLGDSITHSLAFWAPLGWDSPEQYLTRDDGMPKTPAGKRWRDTLFSPPQPFVSVVPCVSFSHVVTGDLDLRAYVALPTTRTSSPLPTGQRSSKPLVVFLCSTF
jgi:hypothetical protein